MKIPIEKILPNPDQPRKVFKDSALQELADSLKENGLVLPITVEDAGEAYILHDGERRLRAARINHWEEIDATVVAPVKEDIDRLKRALVANIQREDLSPIEEGKAYARMREMGSSVNSIAHSLGTYAIRVQSRLDLLRLDPEIQHLVDMNLLPIDRRVIDALMSVTNMVARLKIAQRLARPGVKIKTIQAACEKLNESLRSKSLAGRNPIMELGRRRYQKVDKETRPNWDILAQAKKLPPWEMVKQAALKACDDCALRDIASETTCQECAAVDFLKYMLELVNG